MYAAAPFSGEFTCSATGCGYVKIIWYRQTYPIPDKAYSKSVVSLNQTTNTLIIPDVTIEDTGGYYCLVWVNLTPARSRVANLFLAGKGYI